MLKKILLLVFIVILFLLTIAVIRTYNIESRQIKAIKIIDTSYPLPVEIINRLSEAITIKTITPADGENQDTLAFIRFHQFLQKNYPLVHARLDLERINKYSLLYTWKGRNTSKMPFLLMAHQDVVPADDSTFWEKDPYSGAVHNGFIYGRGSLDIKSGVLGILEAVESLLARGYIPDATIYLAFGHDEESGKGEGAMAIANLLSRRNVELDFVLDEGGLILKDALPGLSKSIALIGVAEKGYMNVKMIAKGHGGHSSMPLGVTAVTRLAQAIGKVNEHPFPASLDGPFIGLLDYASPEMKFPFNVLFTNRWIFSSVIKSQMQKAASSNAAIRTTSAITMLNGSSKENVIPSEATATINIRLMPGILPDDVVNHFNEVIEDSMVSLKIMQPYQLASGVSDTAAVSFKKIQKSIAAVYPEVITAPFLLVALTDSRHYAGIAKNIYRFHPANYEKSDLARLHGRDERISIEDYKRVIAFYRSVIEGE